MARKNLLDGLMRAAAPTDPEAPADDPPRGAQPRVDVARPRYSGGAIGAVSQSIAELKSRALSDIDTGLIDGGGLIDRIDLDDPDHAALVASIRDHGQQVPILVRPHPEVQGRFQIVYGRRRLAALRALALPARTLVRDLDDRGVVMAQGQENSARRNLTFIEKVNFARQMRAADYDRKTICDALSLDKTVISRMLAIADRVPTDLIELVGSAPAIGRDRWLELATLFETGQSDIEAARIIVGQLPETASSDIRFEAVLASALPRAPAQPRPKPPRAETVTTAEGAPLARITRKRDELTLSLRRDDADGFEDWLAERLPQIHRDWIASRSRDD